MVRSNKKNCFEFLVEFVTVTNGRKSFNILHSLSDHHPCTPTHLICCYFYEMLLIAEMQSSSKYKETYLG